MFGLIGHKLSHSFSPQIHALLSDYEYNLFEMEENEVGQFLQKREFQGTNVTIPYKKTVIPFLDEVSDTAKRIGSVNTIVKRPDDTLFGDNTDYYGFSYMIKQSGAVIKGKKCIVLGSGGASLTVIAVLSDMKASSVTVISRSGSDNYENISKHFDAEIIVNTTPVGMYPNCGASPIDLSSFTACECVLDLIYNPAKTALLLQAEKLSIPYINGLTMLVAQAKKACELFLDKPLNDSIIPEITEKLTRQSMNIVLVGMPGSGKSTIGHIIAEKLSRKFFDTDTELENNYGDKIPNIIQEKGEQLFRNLEEKSVAECGKQSYCVIATGGGAILRQANIDALRQNGQIVFLDRPIDSLVTNGRPLSSTPEKVQALYETRLPIYNSCCDIKIEVKGTPEEVAEKIIKELEL